MTRFILTYLLLSFTACLLAQTTYTINTTDDLDDGTCDAVHCSLREAIQAANGDADLSTIAFDISGAAPFIIEPITPLPELTEAGTIIDGTTQVGYTLGDIIIDGQNTLPANSGIRSSASQTEIYGLKVINFTPSNNAAIDINGDTVNDIIIGAPGKGNIVGNSHQGIRVWNTQCTNVTIQSNYVGVDPTSGFADIGNTINGIVVMQGDCANVLIGGDATIGEGNIVGLNGGGIRTRVSATTIQGNIVGTDPTGTLDLGNDNTGILLDDLPGMPFNCLVGGPNQGQGNVVAYNNIGIFNNPTATNNRFQRNSTFCNQFDGIRLGQGSNQGIDTPEINCANTNQIDGTGLPNAIIEVFTHDDMECPGVPCQGRTFIGEAMVDAAGNWTLPLSITAGVEVTATQTNEQNNTSEFANCATVLAAPSAMADNDGPFCEGSAISLLGNVIGNPPGISYSWSGPAGYASTLQNPMDATVEGQYILSVEQAGCILDSDTTIVALIPAQRDTIGDDSNEFLCENESLLINGTTYSAMNPTGEELLAGQNGACDTIVTIDLQFLPIPSVTLDTFLCPGESLMVNGSLFNAANPGGLVTFSGGAANGCDSLVNVSVSIFPEASGSIDTTICQTANFTFNGTLYDTNNTSGTETLMGASVNGCDSLVNVSVSFFPEASSSIDTSICQTASFTFNGTLYDTNNTSGTETLTGASVNGCDSLVNVSVSFFPEASSSIDTALCEGQQLIVNGTIYDSNNLSGSEVLVGASVGGCDSTVQVSLTIINGIDLFIEDNLCAGEQVMLYGEAFDENNLSGSILVPGASGACDTIVSVSLTLLQASTNTIDLTLCPEEEVLVNGTTYDIDQPTGTEVLAGGNAVGCDSIIQINLSFSDPTLELSSEGPSCPNITDGFIQLLSFSGGSGPYTLSVDGGTATVINNFPFLLSSLAAGTYQLDLEDSNGCLIQESVTLSAATPLSIALGDDQRIALGDSIQLSAQVTPPDATISWSPSSGLSCINCPTPWARPLETTLYTATISNGDGCSSSDQLLLIVDPLPPVFFPSAFSPNDDGVNDNFTLFTDKTDLQVIRFVIHNRWGGVVFEQNDLAPNVLNQGWDGTVRGQLAPQGVYVYFAEVQLLNGEMVVMSGEVVLVR